MRKIFALLAVALLMFSGCNGDVTDDVGAPEPGAEPVSLAVVATDYAFESAATTSAGFVEVEMENQGEEPHQVTIIQLGEGSILEDVEAAFEAEDPEAALADVGRFVGGPGGVDPGMTSTATLELEEGSYAFLCFIPNAEGVPHAALGMVSEIEIEGPAEGDEPASEATIGLVDFDFEGNLNEHLGETVEIRNQGSQPHEIQILGVAEGREAEDVQAFLEGTAEPGPPPFTTQGGTAAMAPGTSNWISIDLEPGPYFFVCFIGDPESGAPHFALGMLSAVTIE